MSAFGDFEHLRAARHDYARIWRRLKPAERDRRITQALSRLAEGETLAQVATTWKASAATLCRALIAYAPTEWRRALAARALVRYEQAVNRHTEEPRNPITRARAWATRWHLEFALLKLAQADVKPFGEVFIGPCPQCREGRIWAGIDARVVDCAQCGWEGDGWSYLRGLVQASPAGAASR